LPLNTRQPGEYILKLGKQRRISALVYYALVVVVFFSTILLLTILSDFGWGIILLLGGFTGSYYLYLNGKYLIKRSRDAENGARAEVEVAALLSPLQTQGWQIEYNLRIQKWGDADVVLHSPKGNWYVIDVKSHGGTKVYHSGSLRKRYGKNTYNFKEGDLIAKVKGQATEIRHLKKARWVTGILCFTRGNVKIRGDKAGGIYVVSATNLVGILLHLDGSI
jgi:hypothetical protein